MTHRVLIVGVTRNCSKKILNEHKILKDAFSEFEQEFYFVESDSNDDTLSYLKLLDEEFENFSYKSLGELKSKIPNRVSRITYCRNKYLEYFESRVREFEYDLVVVADRDNVNKKLTRKSVSSCIAIDGWSACTANQRGPYYDIYALRAKGWSEIDINQEHNYLKSLGKSPFMNFYLSVIRKMFRKRGSEPFLVDSAFGGCAIYKASELLNHRYLEFDEVGELQCEHVVLHNSMNKSGAKIYLVPTFINANWTQNSWRAIVKLMGLILLGGRYYHMRNERIM